MSGDLTDRASSGRAGCDLRSCGVFLALVLGTLAVAPAQAQTFNQALQRACNVSPVLGPTCLAGSAGSAGSVTGVTPENTPLQQKTPEIEQQKIQRVVGPFSIFASGEYERFHRHVTLYEPGQRTDIARVLAGVDLSFSDRLTVGAAFRYAREDGDFIGGGRFDTDSYGGLVHLNFVPVRQLFFDLFGGYTRRDYSLRRIGFFDDNGQITSVGTARSDTEGDEYQAGINGGYDFVSGNVTVGPRFGLHYRRTEIDGFREQGPAPILRLTFDDQDEDSLTTQLGVHGSVAVSTGFGVLVPQATAEYVHEFLDRRRSLAFRAPGSQQKFRFENDRPDRNYFNLGAGVVLVLARGISPFVNYRTLVGHKDQSSHIVTGGLRVEF
jgi:outer membrane autotransporter protein